jgi:hypothetical protein
LVSFIGAFAGFALAFALIHGFSFIGVAFPVWMVSRVIDPILYEPLLPIPLPTSNSVSFGCEALSPFPPRGVEARAIFCSKFAVLVASEPREAPPCDASLSSSCTQMHLRCKNKTKAEINLIPTQPDTLSNTVEFETISAKAQTSALDNTCFCTNPAGSLGGQQCPSKTFNSP